MVILSVTPCLLGKIRGGSSIPSGTYLLGFLLQIHPQTYYKIRKNTQYTSTTRLDLTTEKRDECDRHFVSPITYFAVTTSPRHRVTALPLCESSVLTKATATAKQTTPPCSEPPRAKREDSPIATKTKPSQWDFGKAYIDAT